MNLYPYVFYHNTITDAKSVPFPYDDYGFLYGYGLFETVRIYNRTPLLLKKHWERLQSSAIILGLELPFKFEDIPPIIDALLEQNKIESQAVLNIYFTAGDRPVGTHLIVLGKPMTLFVIRPMTQTRINVGIHLGIRQASFQRIQIDQFKMLAYIKNILEKSLCDPYDDVILYSEEHTILETPTANVFFSRGKTIYTPKSDYILPGVTRQYILENAPRFGITAVEQIISLRDLPTFEEVFLTNSLKGIVRVDQLEKYPNLKSRELTRQLQHTYNKSLSLPT